MKSRTLGNSQFEISEVGLGCWQLGADWGEGISRDDALKILDTAVDHGINFFDTADVYGNGKSERLIGEFIKGSSTNLIVATKFGRGGNVFPDDYSENKLRESIEGSLERLGKSSLDLLQLHCIPTVELEKGEIFDWLRNLKSEGLIKAFGASVESVYEGNLCLKQEDISSLQVIFNIFRQKPAQELFPFAKEKNVGIIVRLPLASGLLSGKFSMESSFSKDDHRNYNRNGEVFNVGETFAGLPFKKGVELADKINQNLLEPPYKMVDLALRWILDHDAVTTIIPGASKPMQVIQNVNSSVLDSLTEIKHDELKSFYDSEIKDYIRGAY